MGSGLLKKANLLSQEKGLAFSNFIQKYSKSVFAIFTKQDNFYFISNSLGFDGESILASYSTIDFWEGLIPEKNRIFNFSNDDDTLNKMLQFFSFEMKEIITKVSIYFAQDKIIFLCNEELTYDFIHDVNFLSFENEKAPSKENEYTLNLLPALDAYILEKAKYKASIHAVFRQALRREITNRLILFFNSSEFSINIDDNSIAVLSSDNKIEEKLLLSHLMYNLQEVIGNKSELIELSV